MTQQERPFALRERYVFNGALVLKTALHVGGGRETPLTDGPVMRDVDGRPFIPGSSFKGAFRAAVERVAPNVPGLSSCGLFGGWDGDCLTVNKSVKERYLQLRKGNPTETDLLKFLDENLCDTCKLFGSPYLASRALFADLMARDWPDIAEIRDGVGINRDSDRAEPHIKFDFEVVPALTEFSFRMMLENPTSTDKGLLAIGLQEFVQGYVPVGGLKSRGLGRCRLIVEKIEHLDFTSSAALMRYLKDGHIEATVTAETFIAEGVAVLFPQEGGS